MTLISIAVTTYNRPDLLRETLNSILSQTFGDFEVLVGNNFAEKPISSETVGISDPRVRFINHPKNLGQLANMNSLLAEAKGRYFTWLNDDDLYATEFLATCSEVLKLEKFPKCVFSSYEAFSKTPDLKKTTDLKYKGYSGSEFLEKFLNKSLPLVGCYGLFDRAHLQDLGGMPYLADGPAIYADHLLAVKMGLLDKVYYVEAPLVYLRTHDQSFSYTSGDLEYYLKFQKASLNACKKIFADPRLAPNAKNYYYSLFRWILDDDLGVAIRQRKMTLGQIQKCLSLYKDIFSQLGLSVDLGRALYFLSRKSLRLVLNFASVDNNRPL